MFALAPHLRNLHSGTAEALLNRRESVEFRDESLRLRLALARGSRARVNGAVAGFEIGGRRLNGRPFGVLTMAQVFFPALAWQLVPSDPSPLDVQSWADVTRWLGLSPNAKFPIRSKCGALPTVLLPRDDTFGDQWTEGFADEICVLVESDDVSPGLKRLARSA